MSFVFISSDKREEEHFLLDFAKNRVDKKVGVSFLLSGTYKEEVTTDYIPLEVYKVDDDSVYFKVNVKEISALDDSEV